MLRAAGVVVKVVGVEAQPLEVASAAGELARLWLTYDSTGSEGPATIIAKAPGTSDIQGAMDAALGLFSRERYVYGELADSLPVRLPRCYYAGDAARREPLLLEDLKELRTGDQVVGLALGDAERLVDLLADMHAMFWEVELPGGDPSRLLSWADPANGAVVTQLLVSGVASLMECYPNRVPLDVLNSIAELAPEWADVMRRCAEGPETFVHNDFRLDNVFFRPNGEPVVIDWQLAGRCRGTQDLAYLLSGSMDHHMLLDCWELLVGRYHARLLARGVGGYALQQCLFHYRQSVLHGLAPGIAMLGKMALGGGDARGLADTLVLRTLTHCRDVEAFATL